MINENNNDKIADEIEFYNDIKASLNEVQDIFINNTFALEANLKNTNSVLNEKLIELNTKLQYFEKFLQIDNSFNNEKNKLDCFKDLLNIIYDLDSNVSHEELLIRILDAAINLLNADKGAIIIFNNEGSLDIKMIRGNNGKFLTNEKLIIAENITKDVLAHGRALFIPDLQKSLNVKTGEEADKEAVMCVPLGRKFYHEGADRRKYAFLTSKQITGVIYLDKKDISGKTPFSKSNLDLLQALADQASVTLLNAILYEKTNIDTLTGLFLRPFFEECLDSELKYCQKVNSHLTVMMMNIDFFKLINNRYGHQIGDEILNKLGVILKKTLRITDICGRYGGDEFVMILPNTDLKQAQIVAKKLHDTINNTLFPGGKITISIGIASYPEHCEVYEHIITASQLIKNAAKALYCAKDSGRNRYETWNAGMDLITENRTSITEILTGNPIRDFRNVQMLLDVIKITNSIREIDDLLRNVMDLILRNIEADRGMIMLYNNKSEELEIKLCRDCREHDIDPGDFIYTKSIVMNVFKNSEKICINNINDDLGSDNLSDLELTSIMCVPIEINEMNIGVIYIDSKDKIVDFTKTELSFFHAIAIQVSMAIAGARGNSYF